MQSGFWGCFFCFRQLLLKLWLHVPQNLFLISMLSRVDSKRFTADILRKAINSFLSRSTSSPSP
jgi:hypothetical protein